MTNQKIISGTVYLPGHIVELLLCFILNLAADVKTTSLFPIEFSLLINRIDAVTFNESKCCSLPRRVEPFDGLLLVAPPRWVFVLARPPTARHGALHVTGDDMAKVLPYFSVFRCRTPRIS